MQLQQQALCNDVNKGCTETEADVTGDASQRRFERQRGINCQYTLRDTIASTKCMRNPVVTYGKYRCADDFQRVASGMASAFSHNTVALKALLANPLV